MVKKLVGCILVGWTISIYGESNQSLNEFYQLKQAHSPYAYITLQKIVLAEPANSQAQLEMGYWLLSQKKYRAALPYFQQVQTLDPENTRIALQIGYIFNILGDNTQAYQQFARAAVSLDPPIRQQSRQAMLNIAGSQTKLLPKPLFIHFYTAPYYSSWARDAILPLQVRFGLTFGPLQQGQIYTALYLNKDTRSQGGQLPAIYADNSIFYGVGVRYRLFQTPYLYAYTELGKIDYLIDTAGTRPTVDYRIGLVGSLNWGPEHHYSETGHLSFNPAGSFYGNLSYYSRFHHDWIGQFMLRQGATVFSYRYSTLEVYGKLQLFLDSNRFYYNNLLEVGPGVCWKPDNRINLALRLEALQGHYLPRDHSLVPPYGRRYHVLLGMIETSWNF